MGAYSVTKAAIALSFGLLMAPTCAFAVDWGVKGTLSEGVELNDNQFLRTLPTGGSLGSYTSLATNIEGLTPTSKFDFDSGATYKKYWGPGVDGLNSEYITYGLGAHYELAGKGQSDKSYLDASYAVQSTALALFNSLGVVPTNSSGFLDQTTVKGGIDRALSNNDSVSLWARSIYTSYDPSSGGGIPFTDTLASGLWTHRMNSVTALTATSEMEYLSYNNVLDTNALIVRNLAGFDMTLSPLLSIKGAAGSAYIEIDNGFGAPVMQGIPAVAQSTSRADFIGNLTLSYRLLKTVTLNFLANRSIGPTVIGSIATQTNVGVGANYQINSASGLSIYATFLKLDTPSTIDYATASIQYSTQLSRTLTGTITYNYIHRFGPTGVTLLDPIAGTPSATSGGRADSNGIIFVLSKSFVILPHGT